MKQQGYKQEMPNNIPDILPHILSEVGKVTLDCFDTRFCREAGHAVEPESIHQICEPDSVDVIWAREIARRSICIQGGPCVVSVSKSRV